MAAGDVTASATEFVTLVVGSVLPEIKAIWVNVGGTINISKEEGGANPVPFVVVAGTALPVSGKNIFITSVTGLAITDIIGLNWGN